ncbi:autoinducer-2 modifying protein LsrG [Candidatus Scalindua japonica]|uniref:Autoinducer-2 modifying protein LsrG n=1 Tax=Candidatus Scalindua japonica TaxID=1284222 RepID=A0A286TW57_9BACT|nr:antibiotic biosynthesis monooxygenase [Candidatus Scalindua japonica]GAX60127.1 autoinducer-2 modifying protein LsrG [Candidatus Scalindua japonica]
MFGIMFRVKSKPDKYQELVEFLKRDGKYCSDKESGSLRFEFYPDPNDKYVLYVYEAYRDENAFKEHQKNDPYQHWDKVIRPGLEEFCVIFKCDAVWSQSE